MEKLKYFYGITDANVAMARFRTLSKQLHPDHTGDGGEQFAAMKDEYDAWKILKKFGKLDEKSPKPKPERTRVSSKGKKDSPKEPPPPPIAVQVQPEPDTDTLETIGKIADGISAFTKFLRNL